MLVSLRPTQKTPSSFDRTVEPEYGESPESYTLFWKETLSSGIKLIGIENYEVPLVEFKLQLKGDCVKSCYNRCLKYAFSVVNQRN
jgi:zinc protease